LGGSGQDLILANWKGGQIKLTNSSGAGTHVITGDGEIIVDSTCTAGTFEIYGDMKVVDNSLGATVIQENSSMLAAEAVWAATNGVAVNNKLDDLHKLQGLDAVNPLTVDDGANRRFVGPAGAPSIDQTIVSAGNKTTVTRTA